MTKIKGSNILITGGGSGIGKAMGSLALKKRCQFGKLFCHLGFLILFLAQFLVYIKQ